MDRIASKGVASVLYYIALGGQSFEFDFPVELMTTNKQIGYEVVLKGLQLLHEVKAEVMKILGNSQLVVNQLLGIYECNDCILKGYFDK